VIWGGAALVVALIAWRWTALLTATLNEELAYASGLDPRREQLILTLALAITVAVAIKVVGVLLIAAMLIIPAAAARNLARTPEAMAVFAAVIGAVSAVPGCGRLLVRHAGGPVHRLRRGDPVRRLQPAAIAVDQGALNPGAARPERQRSGMSNVIPRVG
jgi:ABC-type Mn2+/Zn2+ transport system permease subunit